MKVGPCEMDRYRVGDGVPIADGVYVGHGGVVVVINNKFVAEFEHLTSKWGDKIHPHDVLAPHDYVADAMSRSLAEKESLG